MANSRTALIVGAGIGGLAAGVALRKAGWYVRILERAATPRELGFALGLAPNAILALQELGLAEAILAQSHLPGSGEARRANGAVLRRVELDMSARQSLRALAPAIALRPVVHGALLAAIPPDALELDSEGVGFETTESVVTLRLRNGRTVQGDVLIGADGIRSIVRKQLHPHEPPLRASGHCGIRGVARDVGRLGDLDGVAYLDSGIEGASVRAGETAIYWYLSLFRDDLPRDINDAAAIAKQVTASFDDQFRGIVASTAPEDLRIDELFDRDPIDDWGAGRVTLLGDAAHPMLPHTGQGAAQALEDAVALGLALSSPGDPAESLRRYERVRARRTRKIVLTGRRIALVTTTKNPLIGWLRDTAIRLVPVRAIVAALVFMRPDDPHRELR